MKRIQTLETPGPGQEPEDRRLRRMPDLLPVCLQDLLRPCQPAVREYQSLRTLRRAAA